MKDEIVIESEWMKREWPSNQRRTGEMKNT